MPALVAKRQSTSLAARATLQTPRFAALPVFRAAEDRDVLASKRYNQLQICELIRELPQIWCILIAMAISSQIHVQTENISSLCFV